MVQRCTVEIYHTGQFIHAHILLIKERIAAPVHGSAWNINTRLVHPYMMQIRLCCAARLKSDKKKGQKLIWPEFLCYF